MDKKMFDMLNALAQTVPEFGPDAPLCFRVKGVVAMPDCECVTCRFATGRLTPEETN